MSKVPAPKSSDHPAPEQGPEASVLTAVVNSFYPELVQTGRFAKERAQQMLSAVTLLSAALIAALIAGGANAASMTAKAAAIAAIVAWVVASGVLAWAATPHKHGGFPQDMTADELIRWVIDDSSKTARAIEDRLRLATSATVIALGISLVSFTVYLFSDDAVEWTNSDIIFSPDSNLPPQPCESGPLASTAVDTSTMNDASLRLRLTCQDGTQTLWEVARNTILAIQLK